MRFFLLTLITICFAVPAMALAQVEGYLVGIPGLTGGEGDFNTFINTLYAMFIGIAAMLAVVKIIVAGLKLMFSESVSQRSTAKKDIVGALIGLAIVLVAVLILTIINPNLTRFNLDIEQLENNGGAGGSGGASGATGSRTESIREQCEVATNCVVQACSDGNCESEESVCEAQERSAIPLDENTILCTGRSGESAIEQEQTAATSVMNNFLNNSEYSEIVTVYTINERDISLDRDLSPTELQEKIDEYGDLCEGVEEDTGNKFEEIEDASQGIIIRACVR